MTIHMLTSPAEGLATFPALATVPHEVKHIAYQQQMKARIILIFQELEKDSILFSFPSFGESPSLTAPYSTDSRWLLLFTTTPVTPVGVLSASSSSA